MKTLVKRILFFSCVALVSSCTNLFEGSAVKTGDAAILLEARKKMDAYDWTGAIAKIASLSAVYQAKREVKALLASAYAGRCGLDFLTIANNLENPGASNLFEILVAAFPGATAAQVTDCELAETTLKGIDTVATNRNADENVLMAFVGFAKMAVIASHHLDTNADGLANNAVDPCTLSDADAAELVTGLANALTSLAAATVDIGGDATASITEGCDALNDIDPTYNICAVTDTASVTTEHRQAIRGVVSETTGGLGVRFCANGVDLCSPGCGT